jgi:spore coat polysaccharide biosynthesis protein SpsF
MPSGDRALRTALILQARMGSTRLPGKSMMDLAGAPLLGRILERVKRVRRADAIVMATTGKSEDDVLCTLAERYGVHFFRGAENDVLDRYCKAATAYGADVVVRLPADNATPEPSEIDRIIEYHLGSRSVFSSNLAQVLGNNYPDGIGAEVIDFWALEEVSRACTDLRKREHPHLNFFDYGLQAPAEPDRYPIGTVDCPKAFARPDLVLDVNTPPQYEFMRALYGYLYPRNPQFHVTDTIAWYDNIYTKLGAESGQLYTYCIDIDGTLCTITDGAYMLASPYPDVIAAVNKLYNEGHRIILMTARGSGTGIDWRDRTQEQLKSWGVKFHDLWFGKPSADIYIDDKTINALAWRGSKFTTTLKQAQNGK